MSTLGPPGITRQGMSGPPTKRSAPEGAPRAAAAKQQAAVMVPRAGIGGNWVAPDPYGIRRPARERISQIDRQRRISSELEQLASLVEYYSTRWWRRVA